jgi:hypothetical protein
MGITAVVVPVKFQGRQLYPVSGTGLQVRGKCPEASNHQQVPLGLNITTFHVQDVASEAVKEAYATLHGPDHAWAALSRSWFYGICLASSLSMHAS